MVPGTCCAVPLIVRTQATPTFNVSPLSLKAKTFSIREECAFEGTACLPGDLQLLEQVASKGPVPCVFWSASLLLFYPHSLSLYKMTKTDRALTRPGYLPYLVFVTQQTRTIPGTALTSQILRVHLVVSDSCVEP